MSQMGSDEGQHGDDEDDESTELTPSVYNVEEDSAEEEAGDEDPEGGEEGAM
jgi:hypothetical protein